jgi:phospholipase/carboxylesterase
MVPFEPAHAVDLAGTRVFIGGGRNDPIAPPVKAERLAQILRAAGVDVTTYFHASGHTLTNDELVAATEWISN